MKRVLLSLVLALVAIVATAQNDGTSKNEEWQSKFDEISKRADDIASKYVEKVQAAGAETEETDVLYKSLFEEVNKMIELGKEVAADGSNPELAKEIVTEVGAAASYDDLQVLMPKDAPWYNAPELEDVRKSMENMALRAPGVKYTDFTLSDLDGKSHTLSEWCAKGNYVLVDFWASWCGPCKKEMPNVVEAYNRFHDKGFDVVGVSFDDSKEAWAAAVKNLNLPWHHVSDLKGWESTVAPAYGIVSIPSNILVGPDGVIVACDLREEKLLNKLAEIYK